MKNEATWQKILAKSIRDVPSLLNRLGLTAHDVADINLKPHFPILVPETWLNRIKPQTPSDPLLLQVLAKKSALTQGFCTDPLEENKFVLDNGVLQKYKCRALITLTEACPIHCQYCFRQHFPYQDNRLGRKDIERITRVIQDIPDIEEIILSGGDPLSLPNSVLSTWLSALSALPQIKRIRFHTRFPVVIAERIDEALCKMLSELPQQVIMVIHSNHANEIDDLVASKLLQLKESNVTLLNQSVFLGKVNDCPKILADLSLKLFDCGVLPYYLHVLDSIQGAEAFDVPYEKIQQVFAELKGLLPGYLVPRLVKEVPGDNSKRWV